MIDIHSHIAWGIDDGMPSREDAITSLKQAHDDGITAIISTPHVIPGTTDKELFEEIKARQKELQILAKEYGVEIYFGAEMFINREFITALDQGIYQVMNNSDYLLVEFDVRRDIHSFDYRDDSIYEVDIRNMCPIIAHVERFFADGLDFDIIDDWFQKGYVFQVNRTSLTGMHGKQIQKNAETLLDKGYVHLIATDTHRAEGNRIEKLSDVYTMIEKKYGSTNAKRLFVDNPNHIIHNEDVEDMEIIKKKKRFLFF